MTIRLCPKLRLPLPALALAMLVVLTMIATPGLGQTFTVLHAFTGGADGANPEAGVTVGRSGILYGTTYWGGTGNPIGYGTVYELTRRGSGWTVSPLFEFSGDETGFHSAASVTIGPNGALYGTTLFGGSGAAGGTVFELQPPAAACKTAVCYWNETVLHSFQGGANDGWNSYNGGFAAYANLTFDEAGNIYGTTPAGGSSNEGIVFELTPSGGEWTLSVLHSFTDNGVDGFLPFYGVIFDAAGNLYGTTNGGGGTNDGTAFELTPSGGTWTENIVRDFSGAAGAYPGSLIMDQSGNLYGMASEPNNGESNAVVFELTPSNGSWDFSVLQAIDTCTEGAGVVMNTAGNLYGVCGAGGSYDNGMIFELTNSGGSWTFTDLHDFTGSSDGGLPDGTLALDASGNLYGTTYLGGNQPSCATFGNPGCGVVWEITP